MSARAAVAAVVAGMALVLVAGLLATQPASVPGGRPAPGARLRPRRPDGPRRARPAARARRLPRTAAIAASAARHPEPSATGELTPADGDDEPSTTTGLLLATAPSPASGTWWAARPNGADRAPPRLLP